jgi:hypothetical protein
MAIYRDKHKFQKALFHAISSTLDPWQRLELLKLAVLRFGTTLIPIVAVLGLIVLFPSFLPGLL